MFVVCEFWVESDSYILSFAYLYCVFDCVGEFVCYLCAFSLKKCYFWVL